MISEFVKQIRPRQKIRFYEVDRPFAEGDCGGALLNPQKHTIERTVTEIAEIAGLSDGCRNKGLSALSP